jgi:hypothetical protein
MSDQPFRAAVIPSRSRIDDLTALLRVLMPVVDMAVIIDNGYEDRLTAAGLRKSVGLGFGTRAALRIHRDTEQPPNLSRLWNVGVMIAMETASQLRDMADIAILNDDALPDSDWFPTLAVAMREQGASAACMAPVVQTATMLRQPDGGWPRLYGPAFMITGENIGIRADERLRWWAGDNDIDMRARREGGTLIVPGPWVPNRFANQTTTGELAEQAGRDRETFREIWGFHAW